MGAGNRGRHRSPHARLLPCVRATGERDTITRRSKRSVPGPEPCGAMIVRSATAARPACPLARAVFTRLSPSLFLNLCTRPLLA